MAGNRMKVAFHMVSGGEWTAGLAYQRNLFKALQRYSPGVEVCLVTRGKCDVMAGEDSYTTIEYPVRDDNRLLRRLKRISSRLLGYDTPVREVLNSVPGGGIDVIFSYSHVHMSVGNETAALYWIPDFQHVHLPEMFTDAEIRQRDVGFEQGARNATLVVLSSEDSENDLHRFMPEQTHKTRVMHFVANVPARVYETDPRRVAVKFDVPERFFYLPNQFWKHKNHGTVLEALMLLKDKGIRPFVVCTGNTSDYRNPTYFAQLLSKISLWGLRDQIALLGLVAHHVVYLLVRQSVCVLNPSLFEGWSTIVEEAKSVGKRVLVSDLAVHREQDAPEATYFDPLDAEDLADKLAEIWANVPPGPDFELEQRAYSELPIRMKKYADTFVSISREAVDIARGRKRRPL